MSKTKIADGAVCSVAAIIAFVLSNGQVRTNERGLELIGNAESCRRDPCVCPAGVLTDGMGNTHGAVRGTIKSDQQIAKEWQANILDAESCVNRYGNGRNLSDNAFSAAVSVAATCAARKCSRCSAVEILLQPATNSLAGYGVGGRYCRD